MIEYIKTDNNIISYIIPIIEKDNILLVVFSDSNMKRSHATMLTSYLLDKQIIGDKILYNLYADQIQTPNGTEYKLVGNIGDPNRNIIRDALLKLYQIPGVD